MKGKKYLYTVQSLKTHLNVSTKPDNMPNECQHLKCLLPIFVQGKQSLSIEP